MSTTFSSPSTDLGQGLKQLLSASGSSRIDTNRLFLWRQHVIVCTAGHGKGMPELLSSDDLHLMLGSGPLCLAGEISIGHNNQA